MTNPIFLDNTILTNFAFAKHPEILFQLWSGQVCTTEAVLKEYQAGAILFEALAGYWQDLPIETLTRQEEQWIIQLPHSLGLGEVSCLAVAFHRHGVFASDDRKARQVAMQFKIPVLGTVGILYQAVEKNVLSLQVGQQVLEAMIVAGYYAPVQNLKDLF
ncbi:MAG: hypothetical protein H6636_10525 [Anaerolineales bacterium]|nr:hypothetical protein [Anaerolineales bacterium]